VRRSADVPNAVGRCWLRDQQPELSAQAFVSWREDAAIRTTWEIFTAHWDDFCYPSSDDVVVWPESERWALFYFHEDCPKELSMNLNVVGLEYLRHA